MRQIDKTNLKCTRPLGGPRELTKISYVNVLLFYKIGEDYAKQEK